MGALYKGTSGLIDLKMASQPDDDNRIVEGYYTNDKIDLHGHIIDREAMIKALPEYREWGTVREMHEYPVGTLVEIGIPEWNYIRTRVAKTERGDEVLKNVRERVYKAFSVGIIVTDGHFVHIDELNEESFSQISEEMTNLLKKLEYVFKITGLTLIENSIVDRPANPAARVKSLAASGMDLDGELPSIDSIRGIDAIKGVLPRDRVFVSNGLRTHVINAMGLSVPMDLDDSQKQASETELTSKEENDMDQDFEKDVATEEVSEEEPTQEQAEVIEPEIENEQVVEETEDIVIVEDDIEEDNTLTDQYADSFNKMFAAQESTTEMLKSLGEKIDLLVYALTVIEEITEEESDVVSEDTKEVFKEIDIDQLADRVAQKLSDIVIAERKGSINNEGAEEEVIEPTVKELDRQSLRLKMAAAAVHVAKR